MPAPRYYSHLFVGKPYPDSNVPSSMPAPPVAAVDTEMRGVMLNRCALLRQQWAVQREATRAAAAKLRRLVDTWPAQSGPPPRECLNGVLLDDDFGDQDAGFGDDNDDADNDELASACHAAGYETGFENGYDHAGWDRYFEGLEDGYANGEQDGYFQGVQDAHRTTYADAYNQAYAEGIRAAKTIALWPWFLSPEWQAALQEERDWEEMASRERYRLGFNDGYEVAFPSGFNMGEEEGWRRGRVEMGMMQFRHGYCMGLEDGRQDREDNGAMQYADGYRKGFADGEEKSVARYDVASEWFENGYEMGRGSGYKAGRTSGHQVGHEEGYGKGVEDGKAMAGKGAYNQDRIEGYLEGHEAGKARGHGEGYARGAEDGKNEGKHLGCWGYDSGYGEGSSGEDSSYEDGDLSSEDDAGFAVL